MRFVCYIAICALLLGCTAEQDRLEAERRDTEAQLEQLPRLKIDSLIPTQGYSSTFMESADEGERVTITFPEPKPVDTVVLVPVSSLDSKNKYRAIGFPVRFRIEAQTVQDETIRIADYTAHQPSLQSLATTTS